LKKKRPNGRCAQASMKFSQWYSVGSRRGGTASTSSLLRMALLTIQKNGNRKTSATAMSPA
jgi:hypothetical protein